MFLTSDLASYNSPWEKKPRQEEGTTRSQDLEFELLVRNSKKKFGDFFGNGNNFSSKSLIILILLLFAGWLFSGFYKIGEEEQAIVLRFGKYNRSAISGLNYHIPAPFEVVIKKPVTREERDAIGSIEPRALSKSTVQASFRLSKAPSNSLMLTGDENIIYIDFAVDWKIKNIKDFVFNVDSPRNTLRIAAESAMREIIANTPIEAPLGGGKLEVEVKTKQLTQEILDLYGTGIEVLRLQLLKVDPPAEVIDAFRDVQNARADKERKINEAEAFQNDIIPRARGEVERILAESEAYKQEVIARSEGDTKRFLSVLNEYKKAKDVTKKRIYIEAMEEILQNMQKVLINNNGNGNNVLPFLPLSFLNQNRKPGKNNE